MDRFVVGTGRCGSTLLSSMLSQHPALLSIFEFFNGIDAGRRFADEPIDGKDFAALFCAEQPFVTAVLRRGYEVPEIVYPFGAGGRYRRDEPLPWVLVTALSRMSDDPDALYDEAVGFARALPRQPAVAHYRALFDWLAARSGRRIWLERSGSSIEYLGELARAFPGARFLHLHRDGRETALSMREHHAYRLPISILYGAPVDSGRTLAELGPIDVHAPPTGDDPVSQILASRPPARYFGAYWQDQVVRGHRALRELDADQYAEVAFEDLVASPREALRSVARFLELPDGGDWIERAAALVRGAPPARFDALAEPERGELAAACRAGMQLLGREH